MEDMDDVQEASITALLQRWQADPQDRKAASEVADAVYAQLRQLAAARLRNEPDTVSTPTDLVHELWLRLDPSGLRTDSRAHFFRVASTILRNILVDRARERLAQKRGGGVECLSLRWASSDASFTDARLLDLDGALERLRREHARHADVVQLRCFGGLALEEIGEALGTSLATVKRDWTFAAAWLADAMREEE